MHLTENCKGCCTGDWDWDQQIGGRVLLVLVDTWTAGQEVLINENLLPQISLFSQFDAYKIN